MKRIINLILLLAIGLCSISSFAQLQTPAMGVIYTPFNSSNPVEIGTPEASLNVSLNGPLTNQLDVQVMNRLTLGVDLDYEGYFDEAMNVSVELELLKRDAFGSQIGPVDLVELSIDYDPFDSETYRSQQTYNFDEAYEFDATIISISIDGVAQSSPAILPANLYIHGEIFAERYTNYNGSITSITGVFGQDIDGTGSMDEIRVNWNPVPGAIEYQLEWAHINDYGNDPSDTLSAMDPADLNFDFKYNSTRISTSALQYSVSNVFDRGWLVFRVRPVGVDTSNVDQLIYGKWTGFPMGNVATHSNKIKIEPSQRHEGNLNWQYAATYAEEGKKKEVVSYFDGSMRNRQVVTKVNSDDNIIVGETIYDHQGRPAINVLPVPVSRDLVPSVNADPVLGYYPNFSQDLNGNEYSRNNFDIDAFSNPCDTGITSIVNPMSNLSGASNYYSEENPNQSDEQGYLPNANLYPFTQVEYTPDNTGRIRRQGGVGEEFQLGSGHESKYLYGQPVQLELDRLFGSEVGYASHYKKNVVIDAHGQASISYLDQEGRVIATALAGEAPNALSGIESSFANAQTFNINAFGAENTQNQISVEGDALLFNTQIVVSDTAQYSFAYDLQVEPLQDSCLLDLCLDCIYNLTLELRDDCGVDRFSDALQQYLVGDFEIDDLTGEYDFTCDGNDNGLVAENFTVQLGPGSYTLVKRLTINQEARDAVIAAYLDSTNNDCILTYTDFLDVEMAQIDSSDCDVDCTSCYEELGSLVDFIADGQGTANDYYFRQEDCDRICKGDEFSPCDAAFNMMLIDMNPGGQYASYLNPQTGEIDASFSPLSIFNVNHHLPDPNASIYAPKFIDAYGVIKNYYLDENADSSKVYLSGDANTSWFPQPIYGSVIKYEPNGEAYVYPQELEQEDFINLFEYSWAKSLFVYHPEYCYYQSCIRFEASVDPGDAFTSWSFDQLLNNTTTMQEAVDNGFIELISVNGEIIYSTTDWFHPTANDVSSDISAWDPFVFYDLTEYNFTNACADFSNSLSNKFGYYEDLSLSGTNGTTENINCSMQQIAAYTIRNGGDFINYDAAYFEFGTGQDIEILDQEWNILKALYRSEKQELKQNIFDCIAHYEFNAYGGCIGDGEFNLYSSPYFSNDLPCNESNYQFYADKNRRFGKAESMVPVQSVEEGALEVYLQTGQCPVTFGFDNLLSAIVQDPNSNWTTSNLQLNNYDELIALFLAADNFNTQQSVPQIVQEPAQSSGNTIELNWTADQNFNDATLTLTDVDDMLSGNWDNLTDIIHVYPSGSGFTAEGIMIDSSTASLVIVPLIGSFEAFDFSSCTFPNVGTTNDLGLALEYLWSVLANNGEFTSNPQISQYIGNTDMQLLHNATGLGTNQDLYWNQINLNEFMLSLSNPTNAGLLVTFNSFTDLTNQFSWSQWSVVDYFDNMVSTGNNTFEVEAYLSDGSYVTLTGELMQIDATGTQVEIPVGAYGPPIPAACQTPEHDAFNALFAMLNEAAQSNNLTGNINFYESIYMDASISNQYGQNTSETGSTYDPLAETVTIFQVDPTAVCKTILSLQNNLSLSNVTSLISMEVIGSPDFNFNYHDFRILAEFTVNGSVLNEYIYGTGCLSLQECDICFDADCELAFNQYLDCIEDYNLWASAEEAIAYEDILIYDEFMSLNMCSCVEEFCGRLNEVKHKQISADETPITLAYFENYLDFSNFCMPEITDECNEATVSLILSMGTAKADISRGVLDLGSDGYLIFGNKVISPSQYRSYISRVSNCGVIIWDKLYDNDHYGLPVSAIRDGDDILVCGYSAPGSSMNGVGTMLLNLDLNGDVISSAKISNGDAMFYPRNMVQLADGNLLFAGVTNTSLGLGGNDAYLVKTTNSGAPIWSTKYGRSNDEFLHNVREDGLGNIYSVGYLRNYSDRRTGFLAKHDLNGNPLWLKDLDMGEGFTYLTNLAFTASNNPIVTGYTNAQTYGDFDGLVLVVDAYNGNTMFSKKIGGAGEDKIHGIERLNEDGDFMLYGASNSGADHKDLFLMKVDRNLLLLDCKSFGTSGDDIASAHSTQFSTDESGKIYGVGTTDGGIENDDDILFFNFGSFEDICNETDLQLEISNIFIENKDFSFESKSFQSSFESFSLSATNVNRSAEIVCASIEERDPCAPEQLSGLPWVSPVFEIENDCIEMQVNQAIFTAQLNYQNYINTLTNDLVSTYDAHCLTVQESLNYSYEDKLYHFMLYYYDQAGNLIKTIPPEGVELLDLTSDEDPLSVLIAADRQHGTKEVFTNHRMATCYEYNSLNQLVAQSSPDTDPMDVFELTLPNGLHQNLVTKTIQMVTENRGYLAGAVGTRGYLYLTNDGGITWERVYGLVASDLKKVLMMDAQRGIAIGSKGMVLKTMDGGNTWDMIDFWRMTNRKDDLNDILYYDNPINPMVMVVGDSGLVAKATDFINFDFELVNNHIDQGYDITGIVTTGTRYIITATNYELGTATIYMKPINGSNWTERNNFSLGKQYALDISSGSRAITGGLDGRLFVNEDITNTESRWQMIETNTTGRFRDLQFLNDEQGYAIMDNFLYQTNDGGATWDLYSNFNSYKHLSESSDSDLMLATGTNGKIEIHVASNLQNNPAIAINSNFTPNPNVTVSAGWMHKVGASGSDYLIVVALRNRRIAYTTNGQDQYPTWTQASFVNQLSGGQYFVDLKLRSNNGSDFSGIGTLNTGGTYYVENTMSGLTITNLFINSSSLAYQSDEPIAYSVGSGANAQITEIDLMNGTSSILGISEEGYQSVVLGSTLVTAGKKLMNNDLSSGTLTATDQTKKSNPVELSSIEIHNVSNQIRITGSDGTLYERGGGWKLIRTGTNKDLYGSMETPDGISLIGESGYFTSGSIVDQNYLGVDRMLTTNNTVEDVVNSNLYDIKMNQNKTYVVGAYGTVLYAPNPWMQFAKLTHGISDLNGVVAIPGSDNMYAVGANSKVHLLSEANYLVKKELFTPPLNDVHFLDASTGSIIGEHFTLRTTNNGGLTWTASIPEQLSAASYEHVWTVSEDRTMVYGADMPYESINNISIPHTNGPVQVTDIDGLSGIIYIANTDEVQKQDLNYDILNQAATYTVVPNLNNPNNQQINAIEVLSNGSFAVAGENGLFRYFKTAGIPVYSADPAGDLDNEDFNDLEFVDNGKIVLVGDNSAYYYSSGPELDNDGFLLNIQQWDGQPDVYQNDPGGVSSANDLDINTVAFTSAVDGIYGGAYSTAVSPTVSAVRQVYTPDGRYSARFFYDKLGRLVVSQNSRQYNGTDRKYSYTMFDVLGRVIEVGEKTENTGINLFRGIFGSMVSDYFNPIVIDDNKLSAWIADGSGPRKEVTQTYYDESPLVGIPLLTDPLTMRKRISAVSYESEFDGDVATYDHATHYSYDIHGNVKTLLHDNLKMANTYPSIAAQRFKRMDYFYDLISGNVQRMSVQNGESDQWHHAYRYDADNRITHAYTSAEKPMVSNPATIGFWQNELEQNQDWQQDARYHYYDHGPLARTELGNDQLQGVDHVYTLQGWLKGVNGAALNQALDPGKDGLDGTVNDPFALDVMSFSLDYYQGDYAAINGTSGGAQSFVASVNPNSDAANNSASLYNGNIRYMHTSITNTDTYEAMPMLNAYRYDQLNRLVESRSYEHGLANNEWNPSVYGDEYYNAFSYDAMGNILTQRRHDRSGTMLEDLTYNYNRSTPILNTVGELLRNRLYSVNDMVASSVSDNDIDDMDLDLTQNVFDPTNPNINSSYNYGYDASGQLIRDKQEGIEAIVWRVDGKVKEIQRTPGSQGKNLSFDYDAMGNRIAKHVYNNQSNMLERSTYYLLDASGNTMSTYDHEVELAEANVDYTLKERQIYGSARLGMHTAKVDMYEAQLFTRKSEFDCGERQYELSNHLGNVLAVFSDIKVPQSSNQNTVDGYRVNLVSTADYSPFGVQLDGRTSITNDYRYGFGGHESDDEVSGANNWYSFGDYGYMPRIGRRPSPDPVFRANMSGYLYGANNPIIFVDPEGTTEFYFNGKKGYIWIGTDGKDNGLVAKVEAPKVARQIIKATKKGLYQNVEPDLEVGKAAEYRTGKLVINADALYRANEVLTEQMTEKGKTGEFSTTICQDENGCFSSSGIQHFSGDQGTVPKDGDISIHGHPTGLTEDGRNAYDTKPSMRTSTDDFGIPFGESSDEASFENFKQNIIVGNNGGRAPNFVTGEDGKLQQQGFIDTRYPAINFFDNKSRRIGDSKGVSQKGANTMLGGNRGKLGQKFDKHRSSRPKF